MRSRSFILLLGSIVSGVGCGAPTPAPSTTEPSRTAPTPSASVATAPTPVDVPEPSVSYASEPLPEGAIARLGTHRMRVPLHHQGSVALDSKGEPLLLTSGGGEHAEIKDLLTGKVIWRSVKESYGQYRWASDGAFGLDQELIPVKKGEKGPAHLRLRRRDADHPDAAWSVEIEVPTVPAPLSTRPTRHPASPSPATIEELVISPDDSAIAFRLSSSDVYLLSAVDGTTKAKFRSPGGSLKGVSSGADRLLFGAGPGEDRIIEVLSRGGPPIDALMVTDARGAVLRKLTPKVVAEVALTPDGKQILALEEDRLSMVGVDKGERKELWTKPVSTDPNPFAISSFSGFGPRGKLFVTADGSQVLFGNTEVTRVHLTSGEVEKVSDSGKVLAVSSDGKVVALLHGSGLERVGAPAGDVPEGHSSPLEGLAFASGGKVLVTSAEDVRFWNPRSGRMLRRTEGKAHILAADPAGHDLIAGIDGLEVFSGDGPPTLLGGSRERGPRLASKLLKLGGAGRTALLLASNEPDDLELWPLDGKPALGSLQTGRVDGLSISPDGTRAVVVAVDEKGESEISQLQLTPFSRLSTLPRSTIKAREAVFVGNSRLAVREEGNHQDLILFDLAIEKEIARIKAGPEVGNERLTASPDGRLLATTDHKHKIRIFRTDPFELIAERQGHQAEVTELAFSPDGSLLASASADTTVMIWDTRAK